MKQIQANADLLRAAYDRGEDPINVIIDVAATQGKKGIPMKTFRGFPMLLVYIYCSHLSLEIAGSYDGGHKYKAAWDRMTQINKYAKAFKAALNAGEELVTVEINEVAGSGGARKVW